MKNKHLVLLFLLTLLVGLAVRRAPWRDSVFFQTKLLSIDTAQVLRMEFSSPGPGGLTLLRNETGWIAEQKGRSARVPPEEAQKMLAALGDLRSIRIAKTKRPDTLGFAPATAIMIQVYAQGATEYLRIGWETIENGQPATYVQLPRHKGIYLAENQLRAVFSKTLTDFRNAAAIQIRPADVCGFSIFGQNLDSLVCQKNDTTGNWESPARAQNLADNIVQHWLAKIDQLKNLPFADLFDETHASKTFFAQINLEFRGQAEPLSLKIYRLNTSNLPEEIPERPLDKNQIAPFALCFSSYPTNYYALSDTAVLRQICNPF